MLLTLNIEQFIREQDRKNGKEQSVGNWYHFLSLFFLTIWYVISRLIHCNSRLHLSSNAKYLLIGVSCWSFSCYNGYIRCINYKLITHFQERKNFVEDGWQIEFESFTKKASSSDHITPRYSFEHIDPIFHFVQPKRYIKWCLWFFIEIIMIYNNWC